MPRIALIHAVTVAIDPIKEAFADLWPEADLTNLLDDALGADRGRDQDLTEKMARRITDLGRYALTLGPAAILYTCSAFGTAIEAFAATAPVPVLKPNEAMFTDALDMGRRIGMVATFGPAIATMEREFEEASRVAASGARITSVLAEGAMDALKRGDAGTHNRLVAEAAKRLSDCDAVMLAHFSTARAFETVAAGTARPVLSSPRSAVNRLRRSVEAAA